MNERLTATALILLALIVVFILFNPSGWFRPSRQPRLEVDPRLSLDVSREIQSDGSADAGESFAQLFARYPIVLVGEMGAVREEVNFVTDLLPLLPSMNVHVLGMQTLLESDQKDIDDLIDADFFDEDLARQLLFDRLVTWGYQEYVDLLHKAWEVNHSADGPLRVLGLNVRQLYSPIRTADDFRDPEKVREVMSLGVPDAHIADVIDRELIGRGVPALVLLKREQSFTRFLLKSHAEEMAALGIDETRQTGKILYDRHGDRFATVLFHSPWPSTLTKSGMQYPANGVIDAALDRLEESEKLSYPILLPLARMGATGGMEIRNTGYARGYGSDEPGDEPLSFERMADLYIITARISDLHAATPIENFIDRAREQYAVENFPGSGYGEIDAANVNDIIHRLAKERNELFSGFDK